MILKIRMISCVLIEMYLFAFGDKGGKYLCSHGSVDRNPARGGGLTSEKDHKSRAGQQKKKLLAFFGLESQ